MKKRSNPTEHYAYDTLAGPVYAFRPMAEPNADRLTAKRDRPQVIEFVVWPYPESRDGRPELRRYFVLNLLHAVARATEIQVRLREQGRTVFLVGLRPAAAAETETFFRAMDALDARMPAPLTAGDPCLQRCAVACG